MPKEPISISANVDDEGHTQVSVGIDSFAAKVLAWCFDYVTDNSSIYELFENDLLDLDEDEAREHVETAHALAKQLRDVGVNF